MQILFDKSQEVGYFPKLCRMLVLAAEWADQSVLRYLLHKRTELDQDNSAREFVLHQAAQISNARVEALVTSGIDVNERDLEGRTALHCTNVGAIARTLLQNGAEINAMSHDGSTPLHHAAKTSSSLELLPQLLEYSAEANCKDHLGNTPLHYAASDLSTTTCLMKMDHLIQYGARVNAKNNDEQTAMHLAVSNGNLESVRLLLCAGAEIDVLDKHGRNVLHTALALPKSECSAMIYNLLLSYGATTTTPPRLEETDQAWAIVEQRFIKLRATSQKR